MSEVNLAYGLIDRIKIVATILTNHCPVCKKSALVPHPFRFYKICPKCQFVVDRGNGFLLSALPISYAIYTLCLLLPLVILMLTQKLSYEFTFTSLLLGAVLIPWLLFNYCKLIALALYYFFMIRELKDPKFLPQAPSAIFNA